MDVHEAFDPVVLQQAENLLEVDRAQLMLQASTLTERSVPIGEIAYQHFLAGAAYAINNVEAEPTLIQLPPLSPELIASFLEFLQERAQ